MLVVTALLQQHQQHQQRQVPVVSCMVFVLMLGHDSMLEYVCCVLQ
jgi:hypothetical protein